MVTIGTVSAANSAMDVRSHFIHMATFILSHASPQLGHTKSQLCHQRYPSLLIRVSYRNSVILPKRSDTSPSDWSAFGIIDDRVSAIDPNGAM